MTISAFLLLTLATMSTSAWANAKSDAAALNAFEARESKRPAYTPETGEGRFGQKALCKGYTDHARRRFARRRSNGRAAALHRAARKPLRDIPHSHLALWFYYSLQLLYPSDVKERDMLMSADVTSVLDALHAIERSDDVTAIMDKVRAIAHPLGYDRILMFAFSASRDELVSGVYWSEGHWFDVGRQMDAETFVRHCPVTRHVLETDQPFYWTRKETSHGRRYRFGAPLQGAGLHGLQVPVFGHNGLAGAICFGGDSIDTNPRSRLTLTQLGVTAFLAARKLIEAAEQEGETPLSDRELEVLRWIASGQRVAEVADTLGLSGRTVENHLRRIRQRLQVKTTAQAIGAALRSGALQTLQTVEVDHHGNTTSS